MKLERASTRLNVLDWFARVGGSNTHWFANLLTVKSKIESWRENNAEGRQGDARRQKEIGRLR
jgi:hypothetical protein